MAKFFGANLEFVREDDYVEYFVYPELRKLSIKEENDSELKKQLEELRTQCMAIVNKLTKERNYIWHKDEFQLFVRTCTQQELLLNDESTPPTNSTILSQRTTKETTSKTKQCQDHEAPHLHGVTHYGDNIADEWFIVYLLTKLTEELSSIVVRVIDSDGEFLLIEAADVLPPWANPDTCEQRVYISGGCMHLVRNLSKTQQDISVWDAVMMIQNNPPENKVSKDIQDCIENRLDEFKTKNNTALHRQIVRLPLGVAMILKNKPSLIAPAVRAFCDRDPIDLKVCRSMRYFPPEQRVRQNVSFTKCLYAMIMHSNYVPDRNTGWHLSGNPNTEEYKEDLLGIKVACGFEILASQAKDLKDIENTPAWKAYVRSLQLKGYFKENIEGSAEYQRLLGKAKDYFRLSEQRFRSSPLVGKEIMDLLNSTEINVDELRDEENNLRASDSDDWLNISAAQLDAMLIERYGPKKLYKSNGEINAGEFTKNISEFLEKQSGYKGVERDSDDFSSGEENEAKQASHSRAFKAKVKKNKSMRQAVRRNPVQVDHGTKADVTSEQDENLTTQVRSFLDFVIPEDKWDSNSEMSDYEDEEDMEHNLNGLHDSEIKAYMDQMDRELANTTIGQSFDKMVSANKANLAATEEFDDIEDFEPININVNTLKNMMDSYKSQLGGSGPVSNLLNAMGVGMSSVVTTEEENDNLKESAV